MGWLVGAWDGIKLKAQYLNSDNSMILIFQYHFWNISIINTIKCIIARLVLTAKIRLTRTNGNWSEEYLGQLLVIE